jgi:hypothetical protein
VPEDAVERVFARSEPRVRALVETLIERVRGLPGVSIDPKGTCIHLNRRVAFAGLHPRKSSVLLNLRLSTQIDSPRIRKAERVSANRYHNELLIESPEGLDAELAGWLAEAHALAG